MRKFPVDAIARGLEPAPMIPSDSVRSDGLETIFVPGKNTVVVAQL